jgi:uncharacterized protein (DUF1697 family)
VRTLIQSGNVVFDAPAGLIGALAARVASRIEQDLGLSVPVQMRSAAEFQKALREHPLAGAGVDENVLHVGFLAERPTSARVRRLDPDRSPGDRFRVVGREIYLICPNGVARTKLTNAYFDAQLGTVSTFRNWRTARKLLAMLARG